MWYITQYRDDRDLGVIEVFNFSELPTRFCVTERYTFGVRNLGELVTVIPEDPEAWTFEEWLKKANVAILASFESDDPIRDLPILFPEYYI